MATDPKVISHLSCFKEFSTEQLSKIAKISNSVCYSPGYVLFKAGERGEVFYILIDGKVEVFYENEETGSTKVDTVSSREMVGCAAMVPPYAYTATEKCLTAVEVLEIKTDELRALIKEDPQIGLKIQEHIIETLNDRILHLRQRALS